MALKQAKKHLGSDKERKQKMTAKGNGSKSVISVSYQIALAI